MISTIQTPNKIITPTHPSTLFPQITTCKTMQDLKKVHAVFIKTGKFHDPLAAAELLRFCALSNNRDLHYARSIFYRIHKPNCFSWNTIIRAFAESECNSLEALFLFVQMMCDDYVEPNKYTFPSVFKACSRAGRVDFGEQVHGLALKFGVSDDEFVVSNLVRMYVMCGAMNEAHLLFQRNVGCGGRIGWSDRRRQDGVVVLFNVMVDGYMRVGDLRAARELFLRMPRRSVVSWNVMISGYSQNGYFMEAVELFRAMQMGDMNVDVSPNYVTLVSVLPAISRLGALDLGKWVHLYAERNGIEIDGELGCALVDMYSKCGSIEKALQVFERLPNKSAITWNTMICGLAMHSRAKEALDYFSRMRKAGIEPSDVSYINILSACSHAGLVEDGRAFFNHMVEEVGLEPRLEHYGCMVDLFGRAGLLKEARELILSMPIEPDDVIWKALLSACKLHGNAEMGQGIAKILMDLYPDDSGSYVALSNLYASHGNWEGVAGVRLRMKEMDIRKDPGCSWIELDGAIHEFVAEDSSHPRAKDIHCMLEEIANKLKISGYQPNISQVMHNVDEEQKESALRYHSEKIAIAYGLISTKPRTPLRIVKNLRMCSDCHSSIKLISEIYEREIIVRDRKRFHHFDNGTCSCNDYW